jgi:hypothetical protein
MPLIGPDPDDYCEHDVDNREPYRPEHPFREGLTIGLCVVFVAFILGWLWCKVL